MGRPDFHLFKNARFLFILFFTPLLIQLFYLPTGIRSPYQLLTSIVTCTVLDFLLHWHFRSKKIFPLSGLLTSIGVFVLNASPDYWPYVLAAVLSIMSKHLVRFQRKHVFNPSNFGTIVVWAYFPEYVVSSSGNWGGYYTLPIFLFLTGMVLADRVNRLSLVASYLTSFFIIALLKSHFLDTSVSFLLVSFHGAATYLYLFYMLTDPATTPSNRRSQVIFGCILAMVDSLLRSYELVTAQIHALFILCLVYNWLLPFVRSCLQTRSVPRF